MMKVLELFAGTRSIGKAFEARGHEVYSVEWNKDFEGISLYADISTLTAEQIIAEFGRPDVIWASPDCSTFSMAAISHHREKTTLRAISILLLTMRNSAMRQTPTFLSLSKSSPPNTTSSKTRAVA